MEQDDVVNDQLRGVNLDRNTFTQYTRPPGKKVTQLFAGPLSPVFLDKSKKPIKENDYKYGEP